MIHFPGESSKLLAMSKQEKRKFLREVDMSEVEFEIKIADFGFSKQLRNKSQLNKTVCGTPLYMSP